MVRNESPAGKFDLSSNVFGQSVAIRIGELAVIFISDGGLQQDIVPKGPFSLLGATVSEYQFRELAARIHYKAALRDATHTYLTSESERNISIDQISVRPYSNQILKNGDMRVFRDWDEKVLSEVIEKYSLVNMTDIFDEDTGKCRTILIDENGKLLKASQYLKLPSG